MNMILTILALTAQAALFQAAPSSTLWLEGDSTLHRYSSTATVISVELDSDAGLAQATALTVKVPVAGLKSGHAGLDKNLQKALKAEEFPEIVFSLASYKAQEATGTLSIAGVAKPAVVKVAVNGTVVTGEHELKMSDFGVKPPKMMMGAVKTDDKVVVKFRIDLKQKQSAKEKV